jgi:hypothetical protein
MLREVLHLVETAEGPISLADISRQLGIDRGVLDGMLNYWVRKGELLVDNRSTSACHVSCAEAGCRCGSCNGAAGCPFMARLPKSYVAARREKG